MRWKIAALIVVLIFLHQDFWLWNDGTLVLGFLPAGLAYHLGYSVTASVALAWLVRRAWPAHLEAEEGAEEPAASSPDVAPEVAS